MAFPWPELSDTTQAFIRTGYGALMLLTLLQALPQARRFFLSERWGGYAESGRSTDPIQNPIVMSAAMAIWIATALAIVAGWQAPWPALVNLLLCRYFFIAMRWRGVLRGMGAPGFLAYWLGAAVFLLDFTAMSAPALHSLALLVLQVDLALIMLSAGLYKATAGYPRNHGMELGLCNPMWGYCWRQYIRVPPAHPIFWTLNQLAWTTEVVGAILMLMPATRELGGLAIGASFVFILTQIRLGFLCEMVIVACLLFVVPGGVVDRSIALIPVAVADVPATVAAGGVQSAFAAALWGYLVLLPLAHAGLYFNFYARRGLPGPIQWLLERYTNFFGIIIWRVFSVDLVNFFIRIHQEMPDGTSRTAVAVPGAWPRFNHVGEMICLTSLFTTMKYYPAADQRFQDRLLRYARTLPLAPGHVLAFEYVSVIKRATHFEWVPAAEYRVDVAAATVREKRLDPTFSPRAAHAVSPVHEGAVPGSYAPARR